MGFFSKVLGSQDFKDQKNKKFKELEEQALDQEMLSLSKAAWLTSRGNHYGQRRNLDQAVEDFNEAIEIKKDYIPAYLSLGIAYREKGLLKEAIQILSNSPLKMRTAGKDMGGFVFELYNVLGTCYLMLGDKPHALEYAKKALESVNDPERLEQKGFAEDSGGLLSSSDSEIVNALEQIIKELEEDLS